MYSLTTLLVIAFFSLIIGGTLGAFILYSLRGRILAQELELRANAAETELSSYQRDVAAHFAETSELINEMTQAYKNVHEHLATGALKLATPAISRQIIDSANLSGASISHSNYASNGAIEPPRDWAPKTPGSKGALSADYGLHDDEPTAGRDAPIATESADDYDFDSKNRQY